VTVKNAGKEKLLANILGSQRRGGGEVMWLLLETKDGQGLLGLISRDSTSTVTIARLRDARPSWRRAKIKRMTSPGTVASCPMGSR
jgi:hypothetical protein